MRNRLVWVIAILCLGFLGATPGFSQDVENLLENGGFEAGDLTAWGTYGDPTAEVVDVLAGASVPEDPIEGNYALHLVVDAAGANNWDIGLQNAGHVFEKGKHYTMSTWMKSKSGDLQVRLKPEIGADPWTAYGELEVTITEEWAEYSTTTPVFAEEITPGTITYHIGFAAGDFWVDGVRWYEGDYVEPDFLNDISASDPSPASGDTDVARDYTVLSWKPDKLAGTHNVYFGETFADVNAASPTNTENVISSLGQETNTLALDRLDLGATYYWRVDEVNATPDKSVFKGAVWSFEVEPAFYTIPGTSITATASSTGVPNASADKTIDGSGLNAEGQHSITIGDMWISANDDPNKSIQYEFDKIYQLNDLIIWNQNQGVEASFGVGAKNITIETSLDGIEWTVFTDMELAQAPGTPTYEGAPPIPMNGTAAKFVRLNIHDNWFGFIPQSGISEIQFTYTPVTARYEIPVNGSVDVAPDTILSWRAGRQAGEHQVYMGEAADALELAATVSEPRLDLSTVDIELGKTYYWRVDEVNETEASLWTGPIWSLTTANSLIVDDFESYGNVSPDRPFQTWLDGIGYSADEFFTVEYKGNGTDAAIGHDIWSGTSPHYNGNIMETSTVRGGRQSLPFYYDNTGAVASQTDRSWSTGQDWSKNGIQTLIVNFYGDPNNTGTSVFVKINGTKVTYPENADLKLAGWHQWSIDLASLGINLNAVTSMSIGVDGIGSGMILVDELGLYRQGPSLITASYSLENNTNDGSGNGHDGVAVGDPVYVTGAEGMGLLFDGTGNQYVDLGNYNPSEGTGQLSVSLWAKWEGLSGFYQGLIGKRDNWATDEMMWHIEGNIDTGALGFAQTAGGVYTGEVLPIGEWAHVGVSFNGSTASFYTHGVETGSGGFALGTDTAASFQFGACQVNGGNPFNGALDEIKIYNRALSAAEMEGLAGL